MAKVRKNVLKRWWLVREDNNWAPRLMTFRQREEIAPICIYRLYWEHEEQALKVLDYFNTYRGGMNGRG